MEYAEQGTYTARPARGRHTTSRLRAAHSSQLCCSSLLTPLDMKRELACLLALCAFTAAMVPRERRDAENADPEPRGQRRICTAEVTSCRWAFRYDGKDDRIVDNAYCECATGHQCVLYASEPEQNTYEYRCKKQP